MHMGIIMLKFMNIIVSSLVAVMQSASILFSVNIIDFYSDVH